MQSFERIKLFGSLRHQNQREFFCKFVVDECVFFRREERRSFPIIKDQRSGN